MNPLQEKMRKQQKRGGPFQGLLVAGILFVAGLGLLMDGSTVGMIWLALAGAIVAINVSTAAKKKTKQAPPPTTTQSRQTKATQAQEKRAQVQTDRESSIEESLSRQSAPSAPAKTPRCDNPEPHRHAAPTQTAADYARAAQEKRRESMGHLFEAGLLTREEYQDELRRLP